MPLKVSLDQDRYWIQREKAFKYFTIYLGTLCLVLFSLVSLSRFVDFTYRLCVEQFRVTYTALSNAYNKVMHGNLVVEMSLLK